LYLFVTEAHWQELEFVLEPSEHRTYPGEVLARTPAPFLTLFTPLLIATKNLA
jgi:hypothetical protein